MKNSWHQIVNSILILLVGIYCVFSFNSKENKSEEKHNTSQEVDLNRDQLDPIKNSTLDGASKIAFVNSDTLKKYYLYYDKFQKTMFNKEEAAKKQIDNKYNSYKKLVDEYQKAAPVMGQREAAEKAENIALLEQEIMMLEKTLTDQVSNELLDLQKNYLIDTYNYMQKIGTELGYDYVLNYQIGGPIYSCASKNDITKTVIESLNKAYNEASK